MTIIRSCWHHGLYLQLSRGEQRVLINPRKPYAAGAEAKTNEHDFGETEVDPKFWQAWLKEHPNHDFIENGIIWEKGTKRKNAPQNASGAAIPDTNQQQRPISGIGRGKNPLYGG